MKSFTFGPTPVLDANLTWSLSPKVDGPWVDPNRSAEVKMATHWRINFKTRRISYIGDGTRFTLNELYSYLQDVFDEPSQMDDPTPMWAATPNHYTFVNGWEFASTREFLFIVGLPGSVLRIEEESDRQRARPKAQSVALFPPDA